MRWLMPGALLILVSSAFALPAQSMPAQVAPEHEIVALIVEGTGNGHGRGLSQWGAYGRAVNGGQSWTQIVDAYYGGTTLGTVAASSRIRVRLLAHDGDDTVGVISTTQTAIWGSTGYAALQARATATANRYDIWASSTVACPEATTMAWTLVAADVAGPLTFTTSLNEMTSPGGSVLGLCANDGSVTHYRGAIELTRDSSGNPRVVNDVSVESYLPGVVPREVSTSWGNAGGGAGMNALRAQAVAARSYALSQNRYASVGGYATTCDTQTCQVYGGAARRSSATAAAASNGVCETGNATFECVNTNRAIADTAGRIRRSSSGAIVSTEFSASNGPQTAGGPFPSISDPHDDVPQNPYHRWTRTIDDDLVAAAYGLGTLTAATSEPDPTTPYVGVWDNRLRLTGTSGTVVVGNLAFRTAFGLPSHGFTVRAVRPVVPSAPTLYSEVVGANEVRLAWTAPAETGGPAITDYGYEISPDGGRTWSSGWAGPASARSVLVGGLIEGGHYQFRLTARNSDGWGAYSNTISALTRRLVPSAPTLYSEVVGANEVRLAWTAPAQTGGPITDYGYEISPDGGRTWSSGWAGPASARSVLVGGLIEGGHYQFRLTARNSDGWGAYSNTISALTRRLVPSAPTLYSEVVGANEVRLAWTAPAQTGGPITDYGYEISPDGGRTWSSGWAGPASARSVLVGGLIEGGHYQFRLTARNSDGWGAYSNTISALTRRLVPSAPTLTATAPDPTTSDPTTSAPETTIPTTVATTEPRPASAAAADPPTMGDASIGDLVWLDTNADGIRDVGEPGLADVIVRLIDAGGTILDEDLSDSQGGYELASPSAGAFSLEVVLPDGYEPTFVDVGPDDSIDSDLDPADVVIGPVETSGRVAFEHAGGGHVDLDVGLIAVPEEESTTQATTTTAAPTTPETTTTISAPTTEPKTTAMPAPTETSVTTTQPRASTAVVVATSSSAG